MAGAGGGPSRRSHTKSRKGCKTCKRRHIRCDETFPQCKNCTKHQVRCDYQDNNATGMDEGKMVSQANLNWTPELEKAIDSWRHTGQFPFPDLQIFPPIQSKNLSRTEARLLYHICQILNDLSTRRATELTIWAEPMLKCLSLAGSHHFVLSAIYAFSATLLAWDTRSSETRALATNYAGNATRGFDEALGQYTDANAEAIMAACIILPWLQTDWNRWYGLTNRIKTISNTVQQYHRHSQFAEYLSQYTSSTPPFTNETSYPLTSESRQERTNTLRTVLQELGNIQSQLPGVDAKWIGDLKGLVQQLHTTPLAQMPKEQFDNLYHVRKMLLWAPVDVIRSRGVDVQTILVLAYYYASSLALEPAFPDIGATFVGALVAQPLEKALSVMQAVQAAQPFDPVVQLLLSFPRKALDERSSGARNTWSTRPSISVSGSAAFELSALSIDLTNQTLPDQYAYTPGLSPAFAPSTLSLIPPSMVTHQSQRSPFLEVPSSSVDSYYGGFSTSPASYHTPTTSTYATSPLISPGIRSSSDASDYQLSPFQHSRHGSIAESHHGGFGSSSPFDQFSLTAQAGVGYGSSSSVPTNTSGDGVAGGLVLPTAVWT